MPAVPSTTTAMPVSVSIAMPTAMRVIRGLLPLLPCVVLRLAHSINQVMRDAAVLDLTC